MKIEIEIPTYSTNTGIKYNWTNGFEIEIKVEDGNVVVISNKAGLISLANHFLNLAQDEIPSGYHMHFDENNSLEEGSQELIIQKK